mmetsp:Transcript_45712/g.118242  ORF Transcript_45712/g.118242 Transcript_45712/m.118242 type:complete len:302 (-) Transcript_45712:270-1175(-)
MMAETKALLQNEALADDRSSQSGYRHSAAIANFASDPGDANYTFRWNNKRCIGSEIHNIVAGDICEDDSDDAEVIQAVERVLVADPSQITKRFTWTTYWKGRRQECSGEAIHIAAARGSCALVKLLADHGACIDSCITRDAAANYNVLHAAIFGEGRGGSEHVVEMLLRMGAQMTTNAEKLSPLHIAFQTGKVSLIHMMQNHMMSHTSDLYQQIHLGWTLGERAGEVGAEDSYVTHRLPEAAALRHPKVPHCSRARGSGGSGQNRQGDGRDTRGGAFGHHGGLAHGPQGGKVPHRGSHRNT